MELAINYTQLFHAKRNRVEIISDFPDGNDAEVLSSLRLHPQGWVALSRNTSSDEGSEWCCVHDIQSLPTQPDEDQAVGERPPLTWRSGGVPRARPSAPVVQVTLQKCCIAEEGAMRGAKCHRFQRKKIDLPKKITFSAFALLNRQIWDISYLLLILVVADLQSGGYRDHQHRFSSKSSGGKAGDRD